MKILIIDDQQDNATALCKLLTERLQCPVECVFANTFEDGLNKANVCDADITLLDLCLPDKEMLDVILSIPLFPPPVIVVSAMDDIETEILCYKNDAQNFFSKKKLLNTVMNFQGAELVSAITKAHWRRTLPTERARALHAQALERHISSRTS